MQQNEKALYRKSQALKYLHLTDIASNDIILLNVFCFFSYQKLIELSKVCKKWKSLIEEVLENRCKRLSIKLFETDKWIFENGVNGMKYLFTQKVNFLKDFSKYFSELNTKPKTCIMFLTEDFFNYEKCIIKSNDHNPDNQSNKEQHPEISRRKNVKEASSQIACLLPKDSLKVFICAEGFIWKNNLEYLGNRTESPVFPNFPNLPEPQRAPVSPSIGGIFLPEHENYEFRIKHLSDETELLNSIYNEESLLKFLAVKPNETLRFLYIVTTDFFGKVKEPLVSFLRLINTIREKIGKNSSANFAVAGNQANDVFVHNLPREYRYISEEITILSLVCKKEYIESVKVAQIILPEKGDDYDEYDSESDEDNDGDQREDQLVINNGSFEQILQNKVNTLKNLKEINLEDDNETFVLLNTNKYGRIHKQPNEQASLFSKEFPNIPIIGCLGFSQIGHDFFPIEPSKNQKINITPTNSNKFNYDAKFYESHIFNSTVFTIISLPKWKKIYLK